MEINFKNHISIKIYLGCNMLGVKVLKTGILEDEIDNLKSVTILQVLLNLHYFSNHIEKTIFSYVKLISP